jgi:Protein of unknwon function (DUF3310)
VQKEGDVMGQIWSYENGVEGHKWVKQSEENAELHGGARIVCSCGWTGKTDRDGTPERHIESVDEWKEHCLSGNITSDDEAVDRPSIPEYAICPHCKTTGGNIKFYQKTDYAEIYYCKTCFRYFNVASANFRELQKGFRDDEAVDRPARYQRGGMDVIDWQYSKSTEAGDAFCEGSIVKYLRRLGEKGDKIEQLKKARVFLDRMIEHAEKEGKENAENT